MELHLRPPARPLPTWKRIGMGAVSPYLYSAPPGLVEFGKTPYVTQTDPQTGQTFTTGGSVVYPGGGGGAPTPAVYQAPALLPAPACTQAAGGAFVSSACVDQALAVEATNLQLLNDANRRVFVANCLAAGNSPADCNSRTYGQTPAGGFTSDAFVQGPQRLQDAAGNFVSGPGAPAGGRQQFSFTNLTSGNNGVFQIGDKWQIQITGYQPNATVQVGGGKDGGNALTTLGHTDSAGNFSYNGSITSDQVGNWQESWYVGGPVISSFSFRVVGPGAGGGSVTSTPAAAVLPPASKSPGGSAALVPSDFLSSSVSIAGSQVPTWALLLAGVGLIFMVGKR